MKTKTMGSLILITTLSLAGISYAVAANQQGMKGNQDCTMFEEGGKGKHKGKMKHKKMGFAQLDLSEEQKQEMQTIMSSSKDKNNRQKNKSERLAYQAEMQALIHSEVFDEEKAKALIDKQQSKKSEKRLAKLKAKHQMFQLLTDEQKTQYTELRSQRSNR